MSYDDLDDYDDLLATSIKQIQDQLDNLDSVPSAQKTNIVLELDTRYKRAGDKLRAFKLDLREIDRADPKRRAYEQKAKNYEEQLVKINQELQWAKSGALKDGRSQANNLDNMNAMELIQAGASRQQESKDSLTRSKQMIAETQQTGTETAVRLKEQREQLENIQTGVRQVESNLKRADRELRAFARRMATDRVIAGFLLLIVLATLFIIIYGAISPDDKINDGDAFEVNK